MNINFKKFQNGGSIAPFLASYTPVQVNTTAADPALSLFDNTGNSTATTAKSSDSIDMKDTMELLKSMRGLDTDVSLVSTTLAQQAKRDALFGTGDPVLQYYKNIDLINKVIESKEEYKDAYDQAKAQGALSEAAISSDGRVVVKTQKGYNLVTPRQALALQAQGVAAIQKNSDLLKARRHDPSLALQNEVLSIVQNSISFATVKKTVDSIVKQLGKSTVTQEGYSAREGNQIQAGIAAIKNAGVGPMDGVYKVTYKNETQEKQAQMALDAVYRNLNDTQKAYLQLNSGGTPEGVYGLLKEMILSQTSSLQEVRSKYLKPTNTSTGSGSSKGSSAQNSLGNVQMDPAVQFALGYGTKEKVPIMGKGQVGIDVTANSIAMQDAQGNPQDMLTLGQLVSGRLGGMFVKRASMDGAMLSPDSLNKVVVDGGRVYSTELPVDRQALAKGIVRPDFGLLNKIEQANSQLGNLGRIPQDQLTPAQKTQINKVYQRNGIAAKYDVNGNLTSEYRRFAVVNGTATERAFQGGQPNFTIEAAEADDQARSNYVDNIKQLTQNKDFKLDNGWFGTFGTEKVYKGTIFIPMSSNFVDYYTGSGIKMSANQFDQIQQLQNHKDQLLSRYNNPGNLSQ